MLTDIVIQCGVHRKSSNQRRSSGPQWLMPAVAGDLH